ncbi:helix-turn-helix transcriptional regulator [Nonomuraea sp. NPDC050310]|uniref:helix-turn-helix domain-containing protein n=1 Tax=unclassified Nonomuraea TaxID=2593643 RepID=UPI0033C71B37
MSTFQQARVELGAQLRRLREASGLTGKDLAERLHWQPSKVSRLENARQTASEEDAVAWAEATGAAAPEADDLIAKAIGLSARQADWRQRGSDSLAVLQNDIRELELRTTNLRVFEAGLIMGLLQTPEYSRQVFTRLKRWWKAPDEIDSAIQARMKRQEILYDRSRSFVVIMPEATLRFKLATTDVMLGQMDRLLAVSTLPNLKLGLIPFEHELPSAITTGFWIFDEEQVMVPMRHHELHLRERSDVEFYAEIFEAYSKVAEFGQSARSIIMRVINDLAKQSPL